MYFTTCNYTFDAYFQFRKKEKKSNWCRSGEYGRYCKCGILRFNKNCRTTCLSTSSLSFVCLSYIMNFSSLLFTQMNIKKKKQILVQYIYTFNTISFKIKFCSAIYSIFSKSLRAILNKSWRQHPTRHQLYDHLPPIKKTIQVRRTRHAGHCWRSRDKLIRDVLLWTPTHGHARAGRPARTYIQQLCEDTGCCPEDLPRAMNDREEWRERVRDIRATSAIWWWWWPS